jgi:CRISPR system Cascade subunit CasE
LSWLARLELDTDLLKRLKILDIYDWHKRLWHCFPNAPEQKRDFLTRIDLLEGKVRAWLLSEREPLRPEWCPAEAFVAKEIAPGFLSHKHYAFDLRANPTKVLIQRGPDGSPMRRKNRKSTLGKRVPLISHEDLKVWIDRKATEAGFRISEAEPLEIGPMVEHHFRERENRGYHGGVQFRGILEVTDTARFSHAYFKGIGSAKGFGFGLLLLSPVQP